MINSLAFIIALCIGLCLSFPNDYKESKVSDATPTEFPWTVMVLSQINSKPKLCGGVLIKPYAVLTAAHCVIGINADNLKIIAGAWRIDNRPRRYPVESHSISKIIVHDEFTTMPMRNDYAILLLDEHLQKQDHIDFICLADQSDVEALLEDRSICYFSGWGKVGNELNYRHTMKKVEMEILDSENCSPWYYRLQDDSICAGRYGEKLVAEGDDGGPLVCEYSWEYDGLDDYEPIERKILVGIYSFNNREAPGIFMNVASIQNWIEQQLLDNDYDDYTTGC